MMESALRGYGRAVGHCPATVGLTSFVITLSLGVFCYRLHTDPDVIAENMDELWSVSGGNVEFEVKTVNKYNNDDWEGTANILMMLGKGDLLNKDIMTPEVFAKIEPLYAKYGEISVTTRSGKTFGTRDLCARGAMPDYPGSQFTMPCLINSPFHCFSEQLQYLPETYQPLDATADVTLPAELFGAPYTSRPSYKDMTADEMKEEASKLRLTGTRGCSWYTALTTFTPGGWGGNVAWNHDKTLIKEVGAIRWTMLYDAALRIKFRMSLSKPEHADLGEIEEALKLHEQKWQQEVEAFAGTLDNVEVLNVGPSLEDDLIEANNRPQWLLMIMGGMAMWWFVTLSLVSWSRPLQSRMNLGHQGLSVVGNATLASTGLWLLMGRQLTGPMISALPFLALGLGCDDMFVLIRYFSELGEDFITEKSYPEIIGEVLVRGGGGATLTSVCNTAAFGCGAMLPIQALADFCLAAAIISVMNYFTMFTQFLPLMVLEARRVKRREIEPTPITCYCQKKAMRRLERYRAGEPRLDTDGQVIEERPTFEERSAFMIKERVGPWLARLPVRVAISVFALALVALSCVSVAMFKEIGFTVSELAPSGTTQQRSLVVLMDYYQTFPAKVCFYELDVPENQRNMLELHHAITTSAHAAPFDVPPYLTMFSFYVLPLGAQAYPGATANETYADMGWTLDFSWTHPQWAPVGTMNSDHAKFYEMWHKWSKMPLDDPWQAFADPSFISADLAFTNEFAYTGGPGSDLKYSWFMFYQTDLFGQDSYVGAIKEVRDVFAASPLPPKNAFPWGPTFTFWSIFLELESILLRAFAIDMVVIFVISLVLLQSFTSALASTLACGMVVTMVFGVAMLFTKFNFFVVALLLASAGISVEFTSHLIVSYNRLEGTVDERLGLAMSHTCPPLLQGAISTLLSILPLAFHNINFVVKYFFGILSVLVAVGLLTGLVLLPALLALLSPVSGALSGKPPAVQEVQVQGSPSEQLPNLMLDSKASSGGSGLKSTSKASSLPSI